MKKNNIIQFIKYCFVGGLATVFDWGTYSLLLFWNIEYLLATAGGFIVGIIINYIISKKTVFTTESKVGKYELLLYFIIGLIGLGFSIALMYGFVDVLNINKIFARMITTAIVLIWNFFARKLIYK